MRALYGFAKAWIFCQLTLTWALTLHYPQYVRQLAVFNQVMIYLVSALCVVRGLPVLFDSRVYLSQT
jgi:hypothetical protein